MTAFTAADTGASVRRVVGRLLPTPRTAPVATAVVGALIVSAVLLRTHPADVGTVVAWASTNVHNLGHHPVVAMIASAFVVDGALLPSVLLVAVAFAALERAIGAWRTVVVAMSGQVIATLITEYGTDLGAKAHLLAAASDERSDVGVSYVMFSLLAAGVLLLHGRLRWIAGAAVVADVVVGVLVSRDMTATGHLLSVALGAATMAWFLRRTPADPGVERLIWPPSVSS